MTKIINKPVVKVIHMFKNSVNHITECHYAINPGYVVFL